MPTFNALDEHVMEQFTNWMTIWSIMYIVVLVVLYAYLFDWMKHLEASGCKCATGLDFNFMKYFPLVTLTVNLFIIILANSIVASKSTTARIFVSIFTILSIPAMIGWGLYIVAFVRFMRRVEKEGCLCASEGEGQSIALWTLVSQICHSFISIVFALIMFVLIGNKYSALLQDMVMRIVAPKPKMRL